MTEDYLGSGGQSLSKRIYSFKSIAEESTVHSSLCFLCLYWSNDDFGQT